MCVCVCVSGCHIVRVPTEARRGGWAPLRLDLQALMSCATRVLGTLNWSRISALLCAFHLFTSSTAPAVGGGHWGSPELIFSIISLAHHTQAAAGFCLC